MPDLSMLTPAGQRMMRDVQAESWSGKGLPAFGGYFQTKDGQLYAWWADGSLAVATFVNGHIVAWKALASPDYDVLFGKTVSRETMPEPDAPHD